MDSQFQCDLKKYRILAGLTQEDLADRVGVRRETIIRLEAGRYNPSLKLAIALSRAVDAPIEALFIFDCVYIFDLCLPISKACCIYPAARFFLLISALRHSKIVTAVIVLIFRPGRAEALFLLILRQPKMNSAGLRRCSRRPTPWGPGAAPLSLFIFSALRHGKLVAAVVVLILRVALDPVEMHRVIVVQRQQAVP